VSPPGVQVETSPFVFDGPVPPEQLGREHELAAFRDRAAHGRFCLLYGPRRFGKTSVIGRLAHDCAADKDLTVVVCDLQGVPSMDDISRRLAAAFAHLNHSTVRTASAKALAGVAEGGLREAGARVGVDIGQGVFRVEDSPPSQTLEQRSVIDERATIIDPLLTSWIRHEHPSP
jgi:AAA+ ATPase superfamily predicted ATPase